MIRMKSIKLLERTIRSTSSRRNLWTDNFQLRFAPKGFGKFYPENNENNENNKDDKNSKKKDQESVKEEKSDSKSESKNDSKTNFSGGGGGGGSGGNGKNNFDPEKFFIPGVAALSTIAYALSYYDNYSMGKEISWQEFQSILLESGQVDRLIVVNKQRARVILRPLVKANADDNGFSTDSWGGPPVTSKSASTGSPDTTQQQYGYSSSSSTDNNNSKSNEIQTRYPSLGLQPKAQSGYYFAIGSVETFERKLEETQRQLGIHPRDYVPVMYITETDWVAEMWRYGPTLALIAFMYYSTRGMMGSMGGRGGRGGGNFFKFGQSNAKMVNKELVKTRFKDVAGCDSAKKEIMEFVEFLKDPKRFTDLGAKIPRGALLCGPPGTGKTLLAKATAGEANVPFFSISGSDFVEMFVGVGPSRVRDLFSQARENAPCIIFIDEIDAVGRKRNASGGMGGNDERENTLNQLLVEMDGFDANSNVVVLAGTNRIDVLDPALTRPGRFDRKIEVEAPDVEGRQSIFKVHLADKTIEGDIEEYASRLAALTPGFTGADIMNICNEAAIIAARRSKKKIDLTDFESATDRVIGGLESKKMMTVEEKRIIAYHEAGHAVAGWFLEHANPLLKVTIVPRSGGALGFAQYLPKETFLRNKEQMLDDVCVTLAGRAAEQIIFGKYTTGASDDLDKVTKRVYGMVKLFGMNEQVGQLSFRPEDNGGFGASERLYSERTAEIMDIEVKAIVDEAYIRTLTLIESKKHEVTLIAECLLSKETITNADVARLIGPRPFENSKEYETYLSAGGANWSGKVDTEATSPSKDKKNETDSNTETPLPDVLSPA